MTIASEILLCLEARDQATTERLGEALPHIHYKSLKAQIGHRVALGHIAGKKQRGTKARLWTLTAKGRAALEKLREGEPVQAYRPPVRFGSNLGRVRSVFDLAGVLA